MEKRIHFPKSGYFDHYSLAILIYYFDLNRSFFVDWSKNDVNNKKNDFFQYLIKTNIAAGPSTACSSGFYLSSAHFK